MSVCYLYVICGDFDRPVCKIGISQNPKSRLSQLQTASPVSLKIERQWAFHSRADAAAVESDLHSIFAPGHSSGEWFNTFPDYVAAAVIGMFRNPQGVRSSAYNGSVRRLIEFVEDNPACLTREPLNG